MRGPAQTFRWIAIWWIVAWLGAPAAATAETGSLFGMATTAAPLLPRGPQAGSTGSSLFVGPAAEGLFAPAPARGPSAQVRQAAAARSIIEPQPQPGDSGPVARLRALIARAEAGPAGYDAVNHGARIRPPRRPTEMTVTEIYDWIRATPGQPHAIGRYQFIPPTLRRLMRELGEDPGARFSPALQNRLADELLREAGLARFAAGELGRTAFMNNLAKIWAGLPNSSGRSHYHGYAGNRATKTWARFEADMAEIFPGLGV